MTNDQIFKLNQLCSDLDDDYYINSGGCCYVASILAKLCEQYVLTYKLVIRDHCGCFDSEVFYDNVKCRCDSEECSGLFSDTCNHYYLMIEDHPTNASYSYNTETDIIIEHINSNDIQWIYDTGEWNDTFDVWEYADIVEEKLIKWFNENLQKR